MQNAAATIYCPNYNCQSPNPETHKFCQQCRTPLPKHYLWAVGEAVKAYQPGEVLANRYLIKQPHILLDTTPGLLPEVPAEVSQQVLPYLKLFPHQLHVPQVYGVVSVGTGRMVAEVVLLEQAPIQIDYFLQPGSDRLPLMPALVDAWKTATALRQLNWLWQIAQLWQPFASEGVATSLLRPESLRVEGSLVRLLELHSDQGTSPTLQELGQLWLQWLPGAKPGIAAYLKQVCQQLVQGQVRSAEQLVTVLDQGLAECGRSQSRRIQIATQTDQGPSRQRNEDACYPPSGEEVAAESLVIVCDGIGGHEGGNVASNLAIASIQQHVKQLPLETALDPTVLTVELERATCTANDVISQRNDDEQRQDRQRMGTTLVMALAQAHELYITHVGDSRAYWITRTGCHQVTLDDDVASREVRMGYSLYRDALQQMAAGSLVQALGMSPSASLYPTVQRFIIDEDCLFLLCSDGLSDNDQVEAHWDTEILPLLNGQGDLAILSRRLVEIANTQNGHDNVTVGLVHYQVASSEDAKVPPQLAQIPNLAPPAGATTRLPQASPTASTLKTQILPARGRSANPVSLLLGILLLLGLGGVLAYLLFPPVSRRIDPLLGLGSTPGTSTSSTPALSSPTPDPVAAFDVGAFLRMERSTLSNAPDQANRVVLLRQPGASANVPNTTVAEGMIPAGSILKVLRKQETPVQGNWLQLQLCSTPGTPYASTEASESPTGLQTPASPQAAPTSPPSPVPASPDASVGAAPTSLPLLQPGTTGWIQESLVAPLMIESQVRSEQLGACIVTTSSPTPTVTASPQLPSPNPGGS